MKLRAFLNDIREFLSYTLDKAGFSVITAHDGPSGVIKALDEKPNKLSNNTREKNFIQRMNRVKQIVESKREKM